MIHCNSINLTTQLFAAYSNVDEVVRFSGQAQRKQLTYATKQLIGREVTWLLMLFDDVVSLLD